MGAHIPGINDHATKRQCLQATAPRLVLPGGVAADDRAAFCSSNNCQVARFAVVWRSLGCVSDVQTMTPGAAESMAQDAILPPRALDSRFATVNAAVANYCAQLGLVKPKRAVEPAEMPNPHKCIEAAGFVDLDSRGRIAYDPTGSVVSIVDARCKIPLGAGAGATTAGATTAPRIVRVARVLPKTLLGLHNATDAGLKRATCAVLAGRVDTLAADCILHRVDGAVIVCLASIGNDLGFAFERSLPLEVEDLHY